MEEAYETDALLYEDATEEDDDGIDIKEYDITATPNDFNVATIFDFIERGTLKIPDFQRNYVWDIKRASKLIESLLLGLPVPQLFLFESSKNQFLVIDGQQRLLTIYFFKKGRFPRVDKRAEIRRIFDKEGSLPDSVLYNDDYFTSFRLQLPNKTPSIQSPFKGLNYSTLDDFKTTFDLRPIRNVVIKQNSPINESSSIFEIFNRLNTGGVNLRPQEIRASLFHSKFYDLLRELNLDERWRRFLLTREPDLHLKDVEIILRAFAMLDNSAAYTPSMVQFLNSFSEKAKGFDSEKIDKCRKTFSEFLDATIKLDNRAFINEGNGRLNVALVEGVFESTTRAAYHSNKSINGVIEPESVVQLKNDAMFINAASKASADSTNVKTRLERARSIIRLI